MGLKRLHGKCVLGENCTDFNFLHQNNLLIPFFVNLLKHPIFVKHFKLTYFIELSWQDFD